MDLSKKNKFEKAGRAFLFKKFEINHHLCAHKVGFDGVLLGAWANFKDAKTILDIGTGSGLIALMAAQKNDDAKISGIEMDEPSFCQAKENFLHSKWKDKLSAIQCDYLSYTFESKFDHIVSNPPFFLNGLETPTERRTNARKNSIETFNSIIKKTTEILTNSGKFSLIIPSQNKEQILSILNHNSFYLSRVCTVFTKSHEISERILIECTVNKCDVEEKNLFVYDSQGNYSTEYIKLTNSFYLNF